MNRELMRLLAHLQESSILPRMLTELKGKSADEEKIHAALMARFIKTGWTGQQKSAWLDFCEQIHTLEGGHSFIGYVDNVTRDFVATFTENERKQVILQAKLWPNAALAALATLPDKLSPDMVDKLIGLDEAMKSVDSELPKRFRTGIVAVLAGTADEASMAHLRVLYEAYASPRRTGDGPGPVAGRRQLAAASCSLSLRHGGPGSSDPIGHRRQSAPAARDATAGDHLRAENGCRRRAIGHIALLEKWTGEKASKKDDSIDKALAAGKHLVQKRISGNAGRSLGQRGRGGQASAPDLLGILTGAEATHGARNAARPCSRKPSASSVTVSPAAVKGSGPTRRPSREVPEEGNPGVDSVSFAGNLGSICQQDGHHDRRPAFTGIVGSLGPNTIVILQANGQKVTLKEGCDRRDAPRARSRPCPRNC